VLHLACTSRSEVNVSTKKTPKAENVQYKTLTLGYALSTRRTYACHVFLHVNYHAHTNVVEHLLFYPGVKIHMTNAATRSAPFRLITTNVILQQCTTLETQCSNSVHIVFYAAMLYNKQSCCCYHWLKRKCGTCRATPLVMSDRVLDTKHNSVYNVCCHTCYGVTTYPVAVMLLCTGINSTDIHSTFGSHYNQIFVSMTFFNGTYHPEHWKVWDISHSVMFISVYDAYM
jgi:hypothetical protein